MNAVPVLTRKGREDLGKVLRRYRVQEIGSMDRLVEFIEQKTGYKFSKSAISDLERGNVEPKWDTLAILAASGYLPYSVNELFAIASEQLEAC